MAKQQEQGIVYVLTNPAMPGLVKIGMTTRASVDARMKELYSTGVPVPFECQYACEVKASDCAKIEKALHTAFEPQRIHAGREFFRLKEHQVIVILELFNRKDITSEIVEEMENDLTPEDKASGEKIKSNRRPPMNYREMGFEIGAKLTFVKDESVQVTISSDKKVLYQGEELSLTAITKQLLKKPHDVAPTAYWEYEGKNLRDIYDETYTLED